VASECKAIHQVQVFFWLDGWIESRCCGQGREIKLFDFMQLLLNKRLVSPFIVLLTAFNILPVGLLSIANIDVLKALSLCIFFLALLRFRGYFDKDIRFATFFFLAILLSALNMMSKGKYMDWTFFYCLNYLNLFLLVCSFKKIQDIKDYINILLTLCLLATFVHFIFYVQPSLLTGPLSNMRMGSLSLDASKVRVFIPGMGFIAVLFTYLISKLLYFRQLNVYESVLLIAFFTSIFIFASVRTYFLGVVVAFVTLLFLKKLSVKKVLYFLGIVVAAFFLLSLISSDMYEFITSRFNIFLRLKDFQLREVLDLDVDYDNEQTFATVYFRIMEVIYVIQNFSNGLRPILFGNLGTLYDFLGAELEIAPHVSIFGIYYLFGLVGLSTFLGFFIYYTKMIIANLKKFRRTSLEFLTISLTIFWFTLFVISFFGGIYYSELSLLVTFIIAASIFLKKRPLHESVEN
jgi:hypothetical protein